MYEDFILDSAFLLPVSHIQRSLLIASVLKTVATQLCNLNKGEIQTNVDDVYSSLLGDLCSLWSSNDEKDLQSGEQDSHGSSLQTSSHQLRRAFSSSLSSSSSLTIYSSSSPTSTWSSSWSSTPAGQLNGFYSLHHHSCEDTICGGGQFETPHRGENLVEFSCR